MAETKSNEQILTEIKTELELKAKAEVETATKDLQTKLEASEKEVTELKAWQIKKDEADKANQAWIDKQIAEKKSGTITGKETKSFNQYLGDAIDKNAEAIRNWQKGESLRFSLMPETKALEVKTVGDMSISANFPNADTVYHDIRSPMIQQLQNQTWIADLLPQGTSTGTSVLYPKWTGGEGGVAEWTTGDKAQIDYDFDPVTAPFKTIAGVVIIEEQMLADIPFMRSFLQQHLLVDLKTKENDLILNGGTTSPVLPGFQDLASSYNGSFTGSTTTAAIKTIIDAAYGQIPDATNSWYRGNLIILNTRDQVNIGLNTAEGSGEFDLPAGSVAFSNGQLIIGGLRSVGVANPVMPYKTFYALDTNSTMVIRRMSPELRMFESADLARQNKVMFRIEERLTLIAFHNAAIVKGVLQTS